MVQTSFVQGLLSLGPIPVFGVCTQSMLVHVSVVHPFMSLHSELAVHAIPPLEELLVEVLALLELTGELALDTLPPAPPPAPPPPGGDSKTLKSCVQARGIMAARTAAERMKRTGRRTVFLQQGRAHQPRGGPSGEIVSWMR